MITASDVPVAVYLQGEYRPDVDYLDGVLEKRNVGERDHAAWQLAVQLWFAQHAREWNTVGLPELRLQVSATRYRVADVAVLDRSAPYEQVPTTPPLAVFEVLSPEDRLSRVRERLADYSAMGVREIWLIDPVSGSFERWEDGQLVRREEFAMRDRGIGFGVQEIRSLVL
jgi:Uma2 family endonuclease